MQAVLAELGRSLSEESSDRSIFTNSAGSKRTVKNQKRKWTDRTKTGKLEELIGLLGTDARLTWRKFNWNLILPSEVNLNDSGGGRDMQ
jgi:hypothetical protein